MNVLVMLHLKRNVRHEEVMLGKPVHCQKCGVYRSSSYKISLHDFFKLSFCAAPYCACYKCNVENPFCKRYCGGVGGNFKP